MKTIKTLAAAALAALALAVAAAPAGAAAPMKKADCLQCHGPLEKLTSMPPMYDADPGKINPHKFIPHDSRDPAKFPECTTCHTPHPLPPPKGFKDKSANVEMCYSCHHNYTFQKCSGCHK